jgi:hypothetical protein
VGLRASVYLLAQKFNLTLELRAGGSAGAGHESKYGLNRRNLGKQGKISSFAPTI